MAVLTFPTAHADFFGLLDHLAGDMWLAEYREHSETGGGAILTADYGPRLWRGSVQLKPQRLPDWAETQALIGAFLQGQRTFHASDPFAMAPASDPAGSAVAASVVLLDTVNADKRRLALKGLPANYVLTRGDRLSVTDSGGGVHLHEMVETVTANGAGTTTEFELTPFTQTTLASNDAVTLVRPSCLALIVPGSFRRGRLAGGFRVGAGFDWIESL